MPKSHLLVVLSLVLTGCGTETPRSEPTGGAPTPAAAPAAGEVSPMATSETVDSAAPVSPPDAAPSDLPSTPQPLPETSAMPTEPTAQDASTPAPVANTHGGDGGPPMHTNRLIDETSPYLLQHAHNPVDWYPWGAEAFEAARSQDKMIFLSIGYSTCYWCHVMERESFEDEAIAAMMNEKFICIKVDREERPDVDDIYMAAVQAMSGRGGWPMSVWIEPNGLRPFLGGTYFPPEDRQGRPGFPSVMQQVEGFWKNRRADVFNQCAQLSAAVSSRLAAQQAPVAIGADVVDRAVGQIMSVYDRENAGYGGAPKFPMNANLDFLIGAAWDRDDVRASLIHTLDRMAMGGMYDQVGGGFHRYSTDGLWLVPHFEKMLYDNGQLATSYAAVYEHTGDAYYAEIIREILDYVLRDMTHPDGGFFSAQDAEVNAREGQNYIWTREEIVAALTQAGRADDVEFILKVYGVDRGTNFLDPHHPEDGRKNVIFLTGRPEQLAADLAMELDAFNARLVAINTALLEVRDTRDQPRLDDKILTGWNGLMIGGFADGGRVLDEPRYLDAARRAASFVLSEMRMDDGGLYRTHRDGDSRIPAFAEDYAFMMRGLLALHRATDEQRWLDEAVALADITRARFWNDEGGGYFDTMPGQSDLFVRSRNTYDGAVPCANSVLLHDLLDLHEATGESRFLDDATATLNSMSAIIAAQPRGPVLSTLALKRFVDDYPEALGPAPAPAVAIDAPVVPELNPDNPVVASVDQSQVALAEGDHLTLTVRVEIAPGYHINAHEPGVELLIPVAIVVQDAAGLSVSVEYGEGELYEAAAFSDEPMRVHEGVVEIPVRLECTGPITGAPKLVITWQACTDEVCMLPKTMVLPVVIEGK